VIAERKVAATVPPPDVDASAVAASRAQPLYERILAGDRTRTPIAIHVADLVLGLLVKAGVPPRYQQARFESFRRRAGTTEAMDYCRELAEGTGDLDDVGVILTGPPGTGKTHLAVSILAVYAVDHVEASWGRRNREAEAGEQVRPLDLWEQDVARRWTPRFASVPRLLEHLRRSYQDDSRGDPMEALERAELLVLDDLGVEKVTDWTVDRLTTLVGTRYDTERPTVVTSNYDLEALANRGYDRIVSRLLEDGPHLRIDARDYRLERSAP
jgi:DNA replication protein DnaC